MKPLAVKGVAHAIAISASDYSACAVMADGHAACWGMKDSSFDKDSTDWLAAAPVKSAEHLKSVVVGGRQACGLREDGRVMCWGAANALGTGWTGANYDTKPPHITAWVRTGTAEDPDAGPRRRGFVAAILTMLALLGMLVFARRVDGRAVWPGAVVSVGAGYRAADVPSANVRPPTLVRAATYLGLAAVGLDSLVVILLLLYSLVAAELGLEQRHHDPFSAFMNLASALMFLVPLAWLVTVARWIVRGTRGDMRALKRWLVAGLLGAAGHVLLGVVTIGARSYEYALVLGSRGFESRHITVWPLQLELLAAAVVGFVASIVLVVASRRGARKAT